MRDRDYKQFIQLQLLDLLSAALQGDLLRFVHSSALPLFFFILSRWALVSCSFFSSFAIITAYKIRRSGLDEHLNK